MSLTAAEYTTLKNSINADPTLSALPNTSDNAFTIAAAYNVNSSPAVNVWKPSIPVGQLANVIDWTASVDGFLSLTVSKQNAYFALTQGGIVDATQANIRNGFSAIFTATIANALAAIAQRIGTRFEVLFSTVSGAANVSTKYGQMLSYQDVLAARNL